MRDRGEFVPEEAAKPIHNPDFSDLAEVKRKPSLEGQADRVFQSRVMGKSLPPEEEQTLRNENYTPTPESHKGQVEAVRFARLQEWFKKHTKRFTKN